MSVLIPAGLKEHHDKDRRLFQDKFYMGGLGKRYEKVMKCFTPPAAAGKQTRAPKRPHYKDEVPYARIKGDCQLIGRMLVKGEAKVESDSPPSKRMRAEVGDALTPEAPTPPGRKYCEECRDKDSMCEDCRSSPFQASSAY